MITEITKDNDLFTFTAFRFENHGENYSDALRNAFESDLLLNPLTRSPDEYGIYLSTDSAGVGESISFWKDALVKTPSFANPANFPWTLANAPASFIAKLYGIQGPVYTFVGKEEAVNAAVIQANIDLDAEVISEAWIIKLEVKSNHVSVKLLRLSTPVSDESMAEVMLTFGSPILDD